MDQRINDKCPPTSDITHSVCLVSEALAKIDAASELINSARILMKNEWAWHREDCDFKLPESYQNNLDGAFKFTRAAACDAFWTQNSLRKYGKTDE